MQMRQFTCTNPVLRGLLVWAEAPHQGLAKYEVRASYYPPKLPQLAISTHFGKKIQQALLTPTGKKFQRIGPH